MIKIFIHVKSLPEGAKHEQQRKVGSGAPSGDCGRGALSGLGPSHSAHRGHRQRDTIAGHPCRLRVRHLGSDLPALLVVGYVRLVRSDRSVWNRADRWLVALLGLLFGWITAANVVSFNDTLVELGLLGDGVGGALAGAFLLLVGAVLASVVILVSGAGPLQGLLAYAGAVLWALTGVVNQYDASLLTTGAALLSDALVATAIINTLGGRRPHIGASRSVRPRAAGGGG